MVTSRRSSPAQVRARAAKQKRRPALSLERIVSTTLRIIDEDGVDAVSMRRVAAEFDTGPASLYAYVENKEGLLRLAIDRVVSEVRVPRARTWQKMLRGWALSTRAILQEHNDIARLTFAHIPASPELMVEIERLLTAMRKGGVPDRVAAWALDIVPLFVAADVYEGWLLGQRFEDGSGRDPEEVGMEYFSGELAPFMNLSAERFPTLTALMPVMMSGGSDERFEFGLDMLIAGFAAQKQADSGS